jgi:hypothetical protein
MIIQPDKKGHNFFLRTKHSTIFDRFCAADYDAVLGFFSARQDFKIHN